VVAVFLVVVAVVVVVSVMLLFLGCELTTRVLFLLCCVAVGAGVNCVKSCLAMVSKSWQHPLFIGCVDL